MTHNAAISIILEFYPTMTTQEADDFLCNHTGWPGFFNTRDHERELRETLAAYASQETDQ